MKKQKNSISFELWILRSKLTGLSELIKFSSSENYFGSEDSNYGIGMILLDIANELKCIEEEINRKYLIL